MTVGFVLSIAAGVSCGGRPTSAEHKRKPATPQLSRRGVTGSGASHVSVAALATARQSSGPDCHHSPEPFDAAFACINERRDISPAAKLVHARLVSQHRLGAAWTQTEIGDALGLSRHQVWRAIGDLVTAGLVQTIRYGLGRPNGYVLLGVGQETLDGKGRASGSRPVAQPRAGQTGTGARHPIRKEERPKKSGIIQPGTCAGCASRDHRSIDCPLWGHVFRRC